MEEIEIAYNRELKPLEAVLSRVKNPGDFFMSGMEEMPMPRIEVEGAGTLSFPLPAAQIAALVRTAKRAPYGRGEETIVDTSVRNVWQIPPGKVKIGGKSWTANFKKILSTVTAGLGCDEATISAELYKLLVYKQGGFFLAHRDTEKTDGMFGTLVVTLPSSYLGGTLRIRHGGREVTVITKATDPSELSYVAFFADCEHEVLPVRQGSRVCLVYNLIQERSKGRRRILKAPEYESQIAEAAAILDRSLNAADAPAKIVWLLDHQYSPAGLSFSALKGADAAKARVLLRAATKAQCAAHLAIVHIGESGQAESDFGYSYRSRRRSYASYEDEEEEGFEGDANEIDDEDVSFTAASVDDVWRYIDEWRDTDDRVEAFGRIPLGDGELLPAGALDGEPPDKKRITEATGNEGATYERSYLRAAFVLWLRRSTADVLLQAGAVSALPYLKQLAAGGESARPEAIRVAERILQAWPDDAHRWNTYAMDGAWPQPSDRIEMIAALVSLNATALLDRFLREVITSGYDGSENSALLSSVSVMGDARAAAILSALVSARMPDRPAECVALLLALAGKPACAFSAVAEAAVVGLDRIGISGSESVTSEWEPEGRRHPLAPEFLENLLRALQGFKKGPLCDAAAEKIASRPEIFSPVTLVVPAIERIGWLSRNVTTPVASSVRHLWASAAEFLLARSEAPPQPPSDWRLDVKLSCACPDCVELQTFARNPAERVHHFRVKKERRRHLHAAIDKHRFDMSHVTERVGSPQTLVCTKDRRTFDRRVKQYENEIAAMRTLLRLADKSCGDALSSRMEAAVNFGAREE
jgi:hypothetical protein